MVTDKKRNLQTFWKILRLGLIFIALLFSIAYGFKFVTGQGKVSNLVIPLSLTLSVVFSLKVFDRRPLSDIGLTVKGIINLLYGVVLGFACTLLLGLQMILTGEVEASFLSTIDTSLLLPNLILCILVGTGEEVLFRGYLFTTIRQTSNTWVAAFVSSALFMCMHLVNPQYHLFAFIMAFAAGLMFIYMFVRTGSLWLAIGFHISWNYFQTIFSFPYTGGMIGNVIVVALNFFIVWLCTNKLNSSKRTELNL
ncbi:CPBP family intramembrane glutamic endopeptidase [Paenibacillus sp. OSY-SE]|uniref:CPBP family intramembrane glutamic endopeptidase n=1 Tax=Paenibacillus sp. OSY-SE TaxID=1196323 RepID=UPI0002E91D46|nr:type II CAAX endopeptidase family protein [Paenibacillus sp. OSY-SE]